MTLDRLPDMPLILEPSGTLRLFQAGEDFTTVTGVDVEHVTTPSRTFVVRSSPGGEFNTQASMLLGQAVFGAVVLLPQNDA